MSDAERLDDGPAPRARPAAVGFSTGEPAGAPLAERGRARKALGLDIVSAGMLVRRVTVAPPDVVFVKGLLEASDGLAALFAERGGELTLVAAEGRGAELSELIADIEAELGARAATSPAAGPLAPARA